MIIAIINNADMTHSSAVLDLIKNKRYILAFPFVKIRHVLSQIKDRTDLHLAKFDAGNAAQSLEKIT